MFTFWSSELKPLVDCVHNDRSYPKVELPLLSPHQALVPTGAEEMTK